MHSRVQPSQACFSVIALCGMKTPDPPALERHAGYPTSNTQLHRKHVQLRDRNLRTAEHRAQCSRHPNVRATRHRPWSEICVGRLLHGPSGSQQHLPFGPVLGADIVTAAYIPSRDGSCSRGEISLRRPSQPRHVECGEGAAWCKQ